MLTFGHPRGADIEPGSRARQSNSDFQFLFGYCNCESFSSSPASSSAAQTIGSRAAIYSVTSSASFDSAVLQSSTPASSVIPAQSFSFTDSGICPSPTRVDPVSEIRNDRDRENDENVLGKRQGGLGQDEEPLAPISGNDEDLKNCQEIQQNEPENTPVERRESTATPVDGLSSLLSNQSLSEDESDQHSTRCDNLSYLLAPLPQKQDKFIPHSGCFPCMTMSE